MRSQLTAIFIVLSCLFSSLYSQNNDYALFRLGVQYVYYYEQAMYPEARYHGMLLTDSACQATYPSIRWDLLYECFVPSSAFIGSEICRTDSITSVRIQEEQWLEIHQQATEGETWLASTLYGGIYGTVSQVVLENFLGLIDSVKYIRFFEDNHPDEVYGGAELRISQHHGVVSSPFFRQFGWEVNSLTLAGMSEPMVGIQNPTQADIFNLAIGDEWHTDKMLTTSDGESSYYMETSLRKGVLTDIIMDESNQTLSYVVNAETLRFRRNMDQSYSDSTLFQETYTEVFDLEDLAFLNEQPGTWREDYIGWNDSYGIIDLSYPNLCSRVGKYLIASWGINMDGCLFFYPDSGHSPDFVQGLAGPYYNVLVLSGLYHNQLIYYNGVNGSCGEPLDFSDVVIATNEPSTNPIAIALSPNPASTFVQISLLDNLPGEKQLVLYDTQGQLLKSQAFSSSVLRLELEDYPSGLYALQVSHMGSQRLGSARFLLSR